MHLSSLAEQLLHVRASELQRHLLRSAVGALHLVCKSAHAALDASLHELCICHIRERQERVQAQSTEPGLQRLLSTCGRRWPAVHSLSLLNCGPVSLAGCTLLPHVETIDLDHSLPVHAVQCQMMYTPSSLPATLQRFESWWNSLLNAVSTARACAGPYHRRCLDCSH